MEIYSLIDTQRNLAAPQASTVTNKIGKFAGYGTFNILFSSDAPVDVI